MTKFSGSLTVLAVILTSGCVGNYAIATGWDYKDAYVNRIDAPATGKKGQPIEVRLDLRLPDPSWSFDSVSNTVDDVAHTVTLKPVAKKQRLWKFPWMPGSGVPAVIVNASATTTFTPTATGAYRLVPVSRFNAEVSDAVVTITE